MAGQSPPSWRHKGGTGRLVVVAWGPCAGDDGARGCWERLSSPSGLRTITFEPRSGVWLHPAFFIVDDSLLPPPRRRRASHPPRRRAHLVSAPFYDPADHDRRPLFPLAFGGSFLIALDHVFVRWATPFSRRQAVCKLVPLSSVSVFVEKCCPKPLVGSAKIDLRSTCHVAIITRAGSGLARTHLL